MNLQERVLGRDNPLYWNGAFVKPAQVPELEVVNPANGEPVGTVPCGGAAEAEAAIEAARQAFPLWRSLTAEQRAEPMLRWAQLIRDHAADIARILTAEQGKPLAEAEDEVLGAAKFVQWYAEEGKRAYGEVIPASSPDRRIFVLREPVGVCGLITPWNYPASMITRKAAPALAAGCTVVLKPASQTPLTAVALFHLLHEAGFPAGVANLVTGRASEIGAAFMRQRAVRKVSFTGSTEVGKALIRQSADQVKRLSLELGGNAPLIVFPDADLDLAVERAVANKFENCGQMCNGINVMYVHRDVAEAFTARLADRVRSLTVGNGFDPGVHVGPLIDFDALARVDALVQEAVAGGARLLTGGHRLTAPRYERGSFYAPTVLADVTPAMRVAREEIFGPVAPVIPFSDEREVLERANDTPYGLAAYVFTRDVRRVFEMAEGLEFGMVAVNSTSLSVPQAPFGGIKESGEGREGGHHGLDGFLSVKYVSLSL
ncbi:MAG: NAD-dependent succinate-semialdehyde dehydrogenase [Alicyclobacillus sp.]|nr:NAD-dependent succinate-semialdehyde dehydrogenase [Alicyclobacillus sp.]